MDQTAYDLGGDAYTDGEKLYPLPNWLESDEDCVAYANGWWDTYNLKGMEECL